MTKRLFMITLLITDILAVPSITQIPTSSSLKKLSSLMSVLAFRLTDSNQR